MNARAISTTSVASKHIRVTQGDTDGIGLEVFLKAVTLLPSHIQEHIVLYCNKTALSETLKSCQLPYSFKNHQLIIGSTIILCHWCEPDAFSAITSACADMNRTDILFTLPASKKSFPKDSPGHTAYFRNFYKRPLGMFFHAPNAKVLLLSDHIPLKKVDDAITSKLISSLTSLCLKSSQQYLKHLPRKVFFAGINPHAGENGILGNDVNIFNDALAELKSLNRDCEFIGPVSGDTLFHQANAEHWLVYPFHDQGLAPFKATHSFIGANITLGLDFLRLSVDHGTALDKAKTNSANYLGALYCLQLAYQTLVKA